MAAKRKYLVLALGAVFAIVVGAGAYVARAWLLEEWWISRLASTDASVRDNAARQLQVIGQERAARALVAGIVDDRNLGLEAIAALGEVHQRVRAETKLWIVERLLPEVDP